jgi:cysteinyl-tRNA synthetase
MRLFNTMTKEVEDFVPFFEGNVSMYCCGPTVYDSTHLGHLRKYTMDDVLRRTLQFMGYKVKHVMNITDVGHLTDDADMGEDKLEKGARRSGKTVWEVAEYYTQIFHESMQAMNVLPPHIECKATDHIPDMIALIKELERKGYTYTTEQAVYFDVTKFARYTELSGQKLADKKTAVRDEVVEDPQKKHPADFSLWFKRVGRFADHTMHWPSPWGDGFPGWHIECSAMSMRYLGPHIDIHTGGIDHIPVHHTNEIAQSEAATDKHPFVKYWVHHNFLHVEGEKMSKSLGNFITIDDIKRKGFHPMALRLLFLQTHYRQQMNFTWSALAGVQKTYEKLNTILSKATPTYHDAQNISRIFHEALADDLNTPRALAEIFALLDEGKYNHVSAALDILGITTESKPEEPIPEHIVRLAQERAQAKKTKDFARADELRERIEQQGYRIQDASDHRFRLVKKT